MEWSEMIAFDKHLLLMFNGSESLFLDGLAKTLTAPTTWIPLYVALLVLILKNNDSFVKVMLVVAGAALCALIAGTLDDMVVKPMVARWRPTHDPEIGMAVDVVNGYRGGSYGFFSAHASNTFSIAIFLSLLIRSRLLTISLVVWSLVNCWTRMYLGVHYPGDILVGLLWGGIVGTAIWYLYRRVCSHHFRSTGFIYAQYTSTGYQLADIDAVISVLLLTLIYAILKACCYLYV